jgi:hypothetical protein
MNTPNLRDLMKLPKAEIVVELPSAGNEMYPETSSLYGVSKLTLRRYGAAEEDILANPDLLRDGSFIDHLLRSVIQEPINVKELLPKDKEKLLIVSRAESIDSEYKTPVTCGKCGSENKNFVFDLNDFPEREVDTENAEKVGVNLFRTVFPNCGAEVDFKILDGNDVEKLSKAKEKAEGRGYEFSETSEELKAKIQRMVFVTDTERYVMENDLQIKEFVGLLLSSDIKFFKKVYDSVQPGLDLKRCHTCARCGHKEDVAVPLRENFFWPEFATNS